MKLIRLKNISDAYFNAAWILYEEAFPIEERRSLDIQTQILQKEEYHFDILVDEEQFVGFILWWDFDTCRYIDYFATAVEQRNKGIGQLMLNEFVNQNNKPIILEVELPTSNINERRIKFYERIGFKLNQHYYEIPPQGEGQLPLQLLVMSYPDFISQRDLELFINIYHPIVFSNEW